jgi:YVTN family beta-propeller protein
MPCPAARKSGSLPKLVPALVAALLVSTEASAQPHLDGAWSAVSNWPLIAVHAAVTPDGRVLTYGTNGDGKQTGYFIYDVWDPAAGLEGGHLTLDNMTLTDIFCSSQVIVPQTGEILIAGGDQWTGTGTTNTGNANSNVFDFTDNTLARSANMNRERWYSSATVLVNGKVYIQGGTGGGDRPEVRDDDSSFRLLSGVPTGSYAALFPRNFLAPDGRVFGYDTNGKMYFVTTGGTGSIAQVGQFSSANAGWTSSAAMFSPGRILQAGGNSNGAVVIDINGPQPTVTATQSMSTRRQWISATVMPDGRVLATGGSEVENQLNGVNNQAEIWDPATGQWHVGTEGALARLYHSSALLLPDASVLVAGGGAPGPLVNTNAELYYPPYLFDESGSFAPRPAIVSAPDTADVGASLTIDADRGDIGRVTLVKTGSVTHSVNMDQRFIELPFSQAGNVLYADLPERASDTPPGFYYLFVFDDDGVPSAAKILKINADTTPNTAVDYTPTVGGGGGSPFQLTCGIDEVLVGVHGRYGTYVHQIGPQCVRVDQFGRWIGDPVDGPVTGGLTSGTTFEKTCPPDSAVSGFRGWTAQYVDRLELQCRALTLSGSLTGTGEFLGTFGGGGGSAQGTFTCGTENPVYALYGRSGSWIDSFGVQCRQAPITPISTNSTPVVVNPGSQSGVVGVAVDLTLSASDSDGDPLTFTAIGLPTGLSIGTTSGRISGVPSAAGSYPVSVIVDDGSESDVAQFVWTIDDVAALTVDPVEPLPSQPAGTPITYTASAHGGLNVRYKWSFGDGSPETPYSDSPSIGHSYQDPGIFFVSLTVTDDQTGPLVQQFVQTVHLPGTSSPARSSSNMAFESPAGGGARLWVVNQDNDSVSAFDAASNAKLGEAAVGTAPRAVAVAPDGRIWVTNKGSSSVSVLDPATLGVAQTITLPPGSAPYGIVFAVATNTAYVVLEGSGQLLTLDASTGAVLGAAAIGAHARHIAIDGSESLVYVSRFVTPSQPGESTATVASEIGGTKAGGEVLVVATGSLTLLDTIVLEHSAKADAENQGAGVPNYLGPVVISPDGVAATVPSKQDNIGRGTLRSGENLNFQNTVRAISSYIDVLAGVENPTRRLDHDNASVASAAVYGPNGVYLFVALETSREIAIIDAHGGEELFRIDVGRAPQGLATSADGTTLYVNNFMDRTVGVYDLSELLTAGQWNVPLIASVPAVASERLDPIVLTGKQLFYDARDTRLARDAYMSCASCHNDGGQDGRVWDLTGMGEGLRATISLLGTGAAHGALHWTENFDEVQDFEGQIRTLAGGTGLMSDADFNTGTRNEPLGDPKAGLSADLDALAAYVESLTDAPLSPYRNADGSPTAAASAGRDVFASENCGACHAGTAFTDSGSDNLHDIGTLEASSGSRLGGPLTGIDTPTLRGVWNTAPYLHNGSAPTLAAAVTAHDDVALDAQNLAVLVAYLEQIDALEPAAPLSNAAPTVANPGTQQHRVGDSVSLQIVASDDGDTLTFAATGLPSGLGIDAASGLVSGTLAAAGTSNVTVTVSDGEYDASTSFGFTVTANTAPSVADPGDQTGTVGVGISLQIQASDIDGDSLSYNASGLPAGLGINTATGRISGIPSSNGTYQVTVTVSDGSEDASTSFAFDIAAGSDTAAPSQPGRPSYWSDGGKPHLYWNPSTDNVGVAGYIVYRSTSRRSLGSEIGRSSEPSFRDGSAGRWRSYYYTVQAYDAAGNRSAMSSSRRVFIWW